MADGVNTRYVHVFRGGEWRKDIDFLEMKPGDVFKMFEPDGSSFKDDKGNTEFKVKEPPFIREDGVHTVETYKA